jgi:uncharacterized membrane protein
MHDDSGGPTAQNEYFSSTSTARGEGPKFSFLTNYAYVLLLIARQPDIRHRDLAVRVGITERAIMRIIEELSIQGYVTITRVGRRNSYRVSTELPLVRSHLPHRSVGDLVAFTARLGQA